MEIRALRETELSAFVDDLWTPFSRAMAAQDPFHTLAEGFREPVIEHHREKLGDDDQLVSVAIIDDELVAYVSAEIREAPPVVEHDASAHVNELYVRPAHRREGVADALLTRAEDWGDERDCAFVSLHVHRENDSAAALYRNREYETARHEMRKPLE